MKSFILVLTPIFINCFAFAQSFKEVYANNLYSSMDYTKASEVYAEVIEKQVKQDKDISTELLLKAANSSYNARSYQSAAEFFKMANDQLNLSNTDRMRYIDCLLRLRDWSSLNQYMSNTPDFKDAYGQTLSNLKDSYDDWLKEGETFEIRESLLNTGLGEYGAVSKDGVIFFSSSRKESGYTHEKYGWDNLNYSNLYMSKDSFDVELVEGAFGLYHDGPIFFDEAHNKVYLTRTESRKEGEKKVKQVQVYCTSLKDRGFGEWVPFKFNSEHFNTGHIAVSNDGETLVFASTRPGGHGNSDLYYCVWEGTDWSEPLNCGGSINTEGDEFFPWFDEDNSLYFSSNGVFGLGGLDIFRKGDLFSKDYPTNLGFGINSPEDDFGFNKITGTNMGFISSDRDGNVDRIYEFIQKQISGTLIVSAKDVIKGTRIENATIFLIDQDSNDTLEVVQNEMGDFEIPVVNEKDYKLVGAKEQYELNAPLYLNTSGISSDQVIEKDLMFTQIQYDLSIKAVVKGTDEPCPNVSGTFTDVKTKEVIHFTTDSLGNAFVNATIGENYDVDARKKGFLDLSKKNVLADNQILIELDLEMQKIEKDLSFKLENILYDLNKASLRDTSKYELDKLVEFMTVNDQINIELSSHTDSRGSKSYNQNLSQQRAQSCVDYLIEKGISKDRIIAKGYGESRLVNQCKDGVQCEEEEHQRNRRTEVKVLSAGK